MKALSIKILIVLLVVAATVTLLLEEKNYLKASEAPSIEGTYILVARELAAGTKVSPPDLTGLITFTKEYRNFNIYWKGPNGENMSISSISKFKFSATEVTETNIFRLVDDEINGTGFTYDFSSISNTVPVTVNEDGSYSFKMPLFDEPDIIFKGDKFEAYVEGAFRDFWEKVK